MDDTVVIYIVDNQIITFENYAKEDVSGVIENLNHGFPNHAPFRAVKVDGMDRYIVYGEEKVTKLPKKISMIERTVNGILAGLVCFIIVTFFGKDVSTGEVTLIFALFYLILLVDRGDR